MQALMSLHQNNKLLVHDKRYFFSHWPPASEIGMLLITNFLDWACYHKEAKRWQVANVPSPCQYPAMALGSRFQKGIFVAWQGNGMVCVNQTWLHCVNQMGKTQSKALAEQHGRGMAWEQHGNGMVCVNQP
jgi:hypothetical protein